MATIPHKRTRRPALALLCPAEYDIRASKNEVSKDLQLMCLTSRVQFSQCSGVTETRAKGSARKRTLSAREAEVMDAVLGLASFLTEGEGPRKSPPIPMQRKAPTGKPKSKPQQPPSITSAQPPLEYQFPFPNYLNPCMDTFQLLQMMSFPAAGLCPYMMCAPGYYGPPVWQMPTQVTVQGSGGMLPIQKYKRAARHVEIAYFIKAGVGEAVEDTTVKYRKCM